MNITQFLKQLIKGEVMPETEVTPVHEEKPKHHDCGDHNDCHVDLNYCDTSNYLFGRIECLQHPFTPLRTAGNTYLGYAVNDGKAKYIKVVWKGETNEILALTKNGRPVEFIHIDGKDHGTKCIPIKEKFCDCDVLNIIELPAGCRTIEDFEARKPGMFKPACEISVVVEYEKECDKKPNPEGDGVFEVYLSDLGTVTIPTSWAIVNMDTIRLNTIPSYVSWDGTKATLKSGVYKLDYAMTIETQTSTSLNFKGKFVVDGVDYPSSFSASHILAGQGGDVSLAQGVTLVVPEDQEMTVEVQAIVDVDSSTNGNADANLVIQRIANGVGL